MNYLTGKLRLFALILISLSLIACGSGGSSDEGNDETPTPTGSTDGGSTDDGSTDDGSTDDGSTDDSSTDDGSTDGGSTDGGSTDGGSTDGGSTDGGSTDGGSTDGGSTDGGSTDGDSTDGGDLANQAPTISSVESVEFSYNFPTNLSITVADPENQAVNINWLVKSGPPEGDLKIYPDTSFQEATLNASVLGQYIVSVTASDGTNTVSKDIAVEVVNLAPSSTGIYISPETPTAGNHLYANIQGLEDDNVDTLSIAYFWTHNGEPSTSQDYYFYSRDGFDKGDTISVYAEISDGISTITTETDTVTVVNYRPYIQWMEVTPEAPKSTDNLNAEVGHTYDADDDDLEFSYKWFINGADTPASETSELTADKIKKGDKVTLHATASDGEASTVWESDDIEIGDSPAVIQTQGLPAYINHKERLSFNISAVDPDGDAAPEISFAYGPTGMTLEKNGNVTWTPDEIMLNKEEEFNFGFRGSDNGDVITHFSITVVDSQRLPPIAKSSFVFPYKEESKLVADYDKDGKNEILNTDSYSKIYTIEKTSDGFEQDWLYPFSIPSNGEILQIFSEDLNKDGTQDIIVVTEHGVSLINDLTKPAVVLLNRTREDGSFKKSTVGDFDNDGSYEIALLSRGYSNANKLEVFEILDWGSEFSWDLTVDASEIRHGNVDSDDALEIILDSGLVYDGESGENQWYHSGGFGRKIAIGDVDQDGIDEITGFVSWQYVATFDVKNKTELWKMEIENDVCSLQVKNVDVDSENEIVIGECGWGDISVYDTDVDGATKKMTWEPRLSDAPNIISGDIDNDGQDELMWIGRTNPGYKSAINVAELDTPEVINQYELPPRLDYFNASGWATIQPGTERATFVVPRTNSGYDGMVLVQMDAQGQTTVTEELTTHGGSSDKGAVVDYDKDGYAELFIGTAYSNEGAFQVRQLDNNQLEWGGSGSSHDSSIGVIEAFDINGDTHEEAIVVEDGQHISIFDITGQTVLWTSPELGWIRDISVFKPAPTASPQIAVATGTELSLWQKENSSYVKTSSIEKECRRIRVADLDGDDSLEIICISGELHSFYSEDKLTILDPELSSLFEYELDQTVTDFAIKGEQHKRKSILIATQPDQWYRDFGKRAQLKLLSPATGDTIWESAPILGSVPSRSLHFIPDGVSENKQITFSSGNAMYISR